MIAMSRLQFPLRMRFGNYYCDEATLERLQNNNQIVFSYADKNPNGSIADIAGIVNEKGNVLGMMPHPERAVEALLGSADGNKAFHIHRQEWEGYFMTTKHEPNPQQIKEEKVYRSMGMTDEEFAISRKNARQIA